MVILLMEINLKINTIWCNNAGELKRLSYGADMLSAVIRSEL